MNRIPINRCPAIALSLFLLFNIALGQVCPVEVINYGGPPDEYLNIVIMGDGYTNTQQDKFINDVHQAVNGFLSQKPFSGLKEMINVYAISVISAETGAASSPDKPIDNYFGSSFGSYGIERLLVPRHYDRIISVLHENTPFYDQGVIIVNDARYGGSGGYLAVFSTHETAIELFLHEFGHSFADLADEYWAGEQYAAEKTNMTRDNNPATIRWRDFLYNNGVGIYPHEESPTWYRPHQTCKMRFLGVPYCDVCGNKIQNDVIAMANNGEPGMPLAFFGANKLVIDEGAAVNFYDFSVNQPETWEWTFEEGAPGSSNEQHPVVTYEETGSYSVSLKTVNSHGESLFTREKYIDVNVVLNAWLIDYSDQVNIYPNPVKDYLIIDHDRVATPSRYRIFNPLGMTVKEGSVEKNIIVAELPPGIYFIHILTKDTLVAKKFIKE
jgi:PKD repeat protein